MSSSGSSKIGNLTHDCFLCDPDNDTPTSTLFTKGSEECKIFCFKRIISVCAFRASEQWLDFSSEGRVIDFHLDTAYNSQVSRNLLSNNNFHDIASD